MSAHRPRANRDLGDGVGPVQGGFQIDENRFEFTVLRQAPQQFSHEARLAHAPLRGHQGVIAVPHAIRQDLKLHLPVEETVFLNPVASALSQHRIISQLICWQQDRCQLF